MSASHQPLYRQKSLNQHSPKFFLTKVSIFTVHHMRMQIIILSATYVTLSSTNNQFPQVYHVTVLSSVP